MDHPCNLDALFVAVDADVVAGERNKARLLKQTAWWKNQLGRGICHYCGGRFPPKELTMDHVTPIIRGGKTQRSNCVPACRTCNSAKQNLPSQSWKQTLEEKRHLR